MKQACGAGVWSRRVEQACEAGVWSRRVEAEGRCIFHVDFLENKMVGFDENAAVGD